MFLSLIEFLHHMNDEVYLSLYLCMYESLLPPRAKRRAVRRLHASELCCSPRRALAQRCLCRASLRLSVSAAAFVPPSSSRK